MNLLIVDDDQHILQHLVIMLKKEGYRVVTADCGKEALQLLQHEDVDGIISALFMYEMDGFQLCRAIKSSDNLRKIPFIFFAPDSKEEDKSFALALGADLFLQQVDEACDVFSQIETALQNPRLSPAVEEEVSMQMYSEWLKKTLDSTQKEVEKSQKNFSQVEKIYQALLERACDAAVIVDAEKTLVTANEKALTLLEYTQEDGTPSFTAVARQIPGFEKMVKKLLQGKDILQYETAFKKKDGRTAVVAVSGSRIEDGSGNITHIQTTLKDVTEKKRVSTHEEERQYKTLFEHAPIGIYRSTPDGRVLMANQTLVTMMGFRSLEELADMDLEKEAPKAGYPRSLYRERLEREGEIAGAEFSWIKRDGTLLFFRENARAVLDDSGDVAYYEGTIEDITRGKKAEEELKKSEERFRALVQNSSDILCILDSEGTIQYVSPNIQEVLGYTEGFIGDTHLRVGDLVHPEDREPVEKTLDELRETPDKASTCEVRIRDAAKSYQWMEIRGKNLLDNTVVPGIVLNIHTITERKQTEDQLRESEERYRTMVELAPDGIATIDLKGVVTSCNTAFLHLTGFSLDDVVGKHFTRVPTLRARDIPKYVKMFMSMLRGKQFTPVEFTWVRKDGTTRLGEIHAALMRKDGKMVGIQVIARDITERKHTEDQLRESEERYRTMVELAPDGIATIDLKGVVTSCNTAFLHLTGFSLDEVVGKHFTRVPTLRARDIPTYVKMFTSMLKGETPKPIQIIWVRKDGTTRLGEIHAGLLKTGEKATGVQVIVRDITERTQMEELLRLSEEKYRSLIENVNVGVYRITPGEDGKFLDVNPALVRILGYDTKEEVLNLAISDLYCNPDERTQVSRTVLAQGFLKNEELHLTRKDGTPIIVSDTRTIVYDTEGVPLYCDGILEDITERKKAEEELRTYRLHLEELVKEQTDEVIRTNEKLSKEIHERRLAEESLAAEKERLSVTLRSIGDGVITTDMESTIVLMNRVAEQLTGYTQKEAVGTPLHTVFDIANEKTRIPCENPVEKVLKQGAIVGLGNDTVLRSRDGTERIIADSGAPIYDRASTIIGVVLVFRDITEKRKMEQELLRTQKLESLGILAGGIAHDFNNILTAILGNAGLARMYAADSKIVEKLTKIEKASLQAKDLTQQLLTFSKGGEPIKKTTSIKDVIENAVSFALRGSNVRCHFYIPDGLCPVDIDEGQISQALNNLVINADQAMPEGGIIEVRAENVVVTRRDGLPLPLGDYMKLSIKDHGVGIAEAYVEKIFDPYFTTKEKGSGLGLATTYSIIKKHNGYIDVESTPGVGTTFCVWLPASRRMYGEQEEKPGKIVKGEGRILLMDDEESIREAAGEVLQYLGYTVVTAKDGKEAVEQYTRGLQSGDPFDVVIMDLTIPGGMGGKEALQMLQEIDPDVKAVVSSGYSTSLVMADYQECGFCGVVTKPYSVEELSTMLNKVLKK
jgi:PAS domain S-box-containing protein